jgi:hypothetical protein
MPRNPGNFITKKGGGGDLPPKWRHAANSAGGVSVLYGFKPSRTIVENIGFMRRQMLARVGQATETLATLIEIEFDQNVPWVTHRSRHGADLGRHSWPDDTARDLLGASTAMQGKDIFTIRMGFEGPSYHYFEGGSTPMSREFEYTQFLERKYGYIQQTFDRNAPKLRALIGGGLTVGYQGAKKS